MKNALRGRTPRPAGRTPILSGVQPRHHSESSPEEKNLTRALKRIRHKLVVMSGKGGVGKSSVAVSLALSLARRGHKVGLMDVDLHGPNVLRMLGLKEPLDLQHAQFPLPPDLFNTLRVISIEMLMRNRDMAVIWRGPLKHQLIRQFLTEVQWDDLDYLVVDSPPGTGDEPMSVAQTIPDAKAVLVTTPQEISLADVRKSINFCQKVNMDPGVGGEYERLPLPPLRRGYPLFKTGGGEIMAREAKVPFLGALPFDPQVVDAADQGRLMELKDSPFFRALAPIVEWLLTALPLSVSRRQPGALKFALPVSGGKLSDKFGDACRFALLTASNGNLQAQELVPAPPHEPGGIPEWLDELGVTHVITAGLGAKAQKLLAHKGIEVIHGAPQGEPRNWLSNTWKKSWAPGPTAVPLAPLHKHQM